MSQLTYLNYDLWIGRLPEGYRARGWDSHGREAKIDFRPPFNELEVENFWLRIGRSRKRMRRVQTAEVEAAKNLGGRLFEAVFSTLR